VVNSITFGGPRRFEHEVSSIVATIATASHVPVKVLAKGVSSVGGCDNKMVPPLQPRPLSQFANLGVSSARNRLGLSNGVCWCTVSDAVLSRNVNDQAYSSGWYWVFPPLICCFFMAREK